MKKIILYLLSFTLLTSLVLLNVRPRPSQLKTNLVEVKSPPNKGELSIQFLGNTNLLLSDGETSILSDGFFSRPSALKALFGEIAPDENTIKACLEKANITHLDAVIPVHSHFDHAMDAPMVAALTGAKLIGSSSTANIGRGYGLNEHRIFIPELGSTIQVGRFEITFIQSNHWQYPDAKQRERLLGNTINEPLITPASIYDYKEGDSYTLLIKHDSTRIAIQGSAGYKENSLPKFKADILFLAVAGLDVMSEEYNQAYQDHLIDPLAPQVLVPIHWDDFTVKLSDDKLVTPNLLFNLKFGSNLSKAFDGIESRNPERKFKVLPVFGPVSISSLIE